MHPDVHAVRVALDKALAGLDPREADRRPEPGRWSIAEIVEHLARAYMGTAKGLRLCLEDGQPRITRSSWAQRGAKFLIVTVGHFPRGRPTPDPVTPKGWSFAQALERAHGGLDALDAGARAASDRFGERALVLNHPVIGACSVRDWRRFHQVHTQHHVKQIVDQRGVAGRTRREAPIDSSAPAD